MYVHSCAVFVLVLGLATIISANIRSEGNDVMVVQNPNRNPHLRNCKCDRYDCGCCEHLKVKYVHLDDTVCTNITYLPDDIGFSLTFTFDSYTVFNTTISARNPPPICIGQEYVKELAAEICIRFYDLDANTHHFHGCLRFDVELYRMKLASYDVGCFDVGPKNSTHNEDKMKTQLGRFWSKIQVPQVNMI